MSFAITESPGLLALQRFLAWCYLEAVARQMYSLTWDTHPELHRFFRDMAFTVVVVDQMYKLELEPDPMDVMVAELNDPADDTAFLMALARMMEEAETFRFPDDAECQMVTDRVVKRLRTIALRVGIQ